MSLPGIDISSFNGPPAAWRSLASSISWAGVKFTELGADGSQYVNPDAAADWEYLREQGKGRLGYLFGHPASSPAETAALFVAAIREAGLEPGDAVCLDHETTDGRNPAQVTVWAKSVLRQLQGQLGRVPVVYTYLDFAAAGNCAGLGSYHLWISDPSRPAGQPRVPAPWTSWSLHQWAVTGTDRDVAAFPTLAAMASALGSSAVPPPAPAPAPKPKEREMILVEVDKATVPDGTPWPGVFLLASDGTLHHVTAGVGSVNNVESYQKAGIPGPVTITYGEYQARNA